MRTYLSFILLLIYLVPSFSQDLQVTAESGGTITGMVYDQQTQSPLSLVDVYLDSIFIGAITGRDGRFILRYIPDGTYTLVVERLGYKPYREENVRVVSGRLISRKIGLQPTEISGEEVLVTAARKEQTAQMAPASVVILRATDLESRPIHTFDQVVEAIPGVSIFRSAGTSVQSLSIRGSSDVAGGGVGNRVLLLVDGRPALTSDAGGAYWSLIPTNFIERVEVVKGAFSSLYGSTAMGGVINVITRRPSYQSLTHISMKYGFYEKAPPDIRYTEKLPLQRQIEASYSGANGRLSYLFNLSNKQSDGHAENTAYNFWDIFTKIMYDLQSNRNLEVTIGGGIAKNDFPHSWLNSAQPLRVRRKYTDDRQEKRQFNFDIHYWAVPSTRSKYSSRFYYYKNAARSYFNENDPNLELPGNEPLGSKTIIDGQKFGNITQVDWLLNSRNYLISGMDIQIDHVNSSPDSVVYGNQQINNLAFYLQDELTLSPSLVATLGIRYDSNHLVGGKTLQQLSPKVAMVYRPRKNIAFRLLYGQAFRAPTIAERFFKRELSGGVLFKPNPDLDAEKMDYSLESGVRWQLNQFVNVDLALFRYHYKDLIYWVDIAKEEQVNFPYFQVRNLNRALMQGAELSLQFSWKQFIRASANYTYLDARDLSPNREDDLLAYRPEHSFFFHVFFNWRRLHLNLDGRYRSKIKEVFLYPLQKPEAFWVLNGKVRYQLNTNFELSVSAQNILNTQYEELARYRMPGRNWMFGISANF
ncbi:MAG: hypothetical protein D6748_09395 [Calditrichaeota bacterium]|nr:MAG: hypothetical protein D6748_09395 [Calditrichota bacterium]